MSAANNKEFPPLKTTNANAGNKLAFHNYASAAASVPMDTSKPSTKASSSGSGTRRPLNTTPTKQPPAKRPSTETEPSLADVLAAIRNLDNKVEDFGKQLKENSDMFASMVQRVEMNSVEITECRSKMEMMEKQQADLKKENTDLKEKILEVERYKRRWNLRLSGLKEKEDENLRVQINALLLKIFPQWQDEIEDVVDSVHCVGRREGGRSRQIIMQFLRRHHRDAVWKVTKDSPVCKEQDLRPRFHQGRPSGKRTPMAENQASQSTG